MITSLKNSSLSGKVSSLDVSGNSNVGGNLAVDTNTLFVDSANNRVGINASSVTDTLTVRGTVEVDSIDGASSFDYSSLGAFTVRTTTEDDPLSIIRYSTSGGGTINLRRSNTDTLGSLSAVASGNMLGTLSFGGYNSSAYDDGAQIRGYASENWTAAAQGSNLRFYTNPVGASAVVERVRIDSEGRVTMPYQPAFSARATAGPIAAGSTMPYNVAVINRGSVFNTTTYRFTAPVTGTYLLSAYDIGHTAGTTRLMLYKNGVDLEASNTVHQLRGPNAANYSSMTSFWLVDASANDYFYVLVTETQSYGTAEYSWFSGFLIG